MTRTKKDTKAENRRTREQRIGRTNAREQGDTGQENKVKCGGFSPQDVSSERTREQDNKRKKRTRTHTKIGQDKRMTRNLRTREQENKGPSKRIHEHIGTRGQDNKVNVIKSGGAKLGDKRTTYCNNVTFSLRKHKDKKEDKRTG